MANNMKGQTTDLECRNCGYSKRASLLVKPAQIAVTMSCPQCGSPLALAD